MVPQLDSSFYFSQLFWLFVCFLILVFVFKKYFIPRMDKLILKRNDYIEFCKNDINKIELDLSDLEKEIKNIKELEIKKTSEILKKAVKKSETILSEQLEIAQEENECMIQGTRKRMNDEIQSLESTFKIQIDITSQIVFDKLFSQRTR